MFFRRAAEEEAPGEGWPQGPSAAGDQPPAGGGHGPDLQPPQGARGCREETQRDRESGTHPWPEPVGPTPQDQQTA